MKEVTKEEYFEFFKGKDLKPISSFSDPDGTSMYGNTMPQMITTYGHSNDGCDKTLAHCEMTKENSEQEQWDVRYFIID